MIEDLIGQIEIFNALELKAVTDYTVIEKELVNSEFKKTIGQIRDDEIYHSKICLEIIEFLGNRTPSP